MNQAAPVAARGLKGLAGKETPNKLWQLVWGQREAQVDAETQTESVLNQWGAWVTACVGGKFLGKLVGPKQPCPLLGGCLSLTSLSPVTACLAAGHVSCHAWIPAPWNHAKMKL